MHPWLCLPAFLLVFTDLQCVFAFSDWVSVRVHGKKNLFFFFS